MTERYTIIRIRTNFVASISNSRILIWMRYSCTVLNALKFKCKILFWEAHELRGSRGLKQKCKSRKHQICIVEFELRKLLLNPWANCGCHTFFSLLCIIWSSHIPQVFRTTSKVSIKSKWYEFKLGLGDAVYNQQWYRSGSWSPAFRSVQRVVAPQRVIHIESEQQISYGIEIRSTMVNRNMAAKRGTSYIEGSMSIATLPMQFHRAHRTTKEASFHSFILLRGQCGRLQVQHRFCCKRMAGRAWLRE